MIFLIFLKLKLVLKKHFQIKYLMILLNIFSMFNEKKRHISKQ
ncbi:hypothetical protein BBUWI9123_F0005 (plasmid) [Borreliella burgdorferi WI91-23]|nr:hypothetical protein BBUWI9123_F0005 [Borreliella burgdorferi WI91-23]